MVEVIVFAEGPSDEMFLKQVVAPSLRDRQIFLKPQTLHTSRDATGGAINFDRLCHYVRNTLRQSNRTYLSTFFDLYRLDSGMPGQSTASNIRDPVQKAVHIEAAFHEALVEKLKFRPERLIPHIQPYELEGLFFSNTDLLSQSVPGWSRAAAVLREVRQSFATPEYINNSVETAPSKRLGKLLSPVYRKTTHAPLIGQRIGLTAIANECPHFAGWVDRIRQLQPL